MPVAPRSNGNTFFGLHICLADLAGRCCENSQIIRARAITWLVSETIYSRLPFFNRINLSPSDQFLRDKILIENKLARGNAHWKNDWISTEGVQAHSQNRIFRGQRKFIGGQSYVFSQEMHQVLLKMTFNWNYLGGGGQSKMGGEIAPCSPLATSLRGSGPTGRTCTPTFGYFHEKTKISRKNLQVDYCLLLKYCRRQWRTLLPPTWAKSLAKFNHKMQDFQCVLGLNCK